MLELHVMIVRHATLTFDLIAVRDLSPTTESQIVTVDVRVEA